MSARPGTARTLCALLAVSASMLAPFANAQQQAWLGPWFLTLTDQGTVHTGILTIESVDGALTAFVDGGPASLTLDNETIQLTFDTRDGGGRLLSYVLSGHRNADAMQGVLTPPLDARAGTWRAERHVEPAPAPPKPVDFTGIWSRTSSGTAKVSLDYTPAAQAAVAAYSYLDDPALRCVSPGVVRVSGWPYPLEIVQNDTQVTILYERPTDDAAEFYGQRWVDLICWLGISIENGVKYDRRGVTLKRQNAGSHLIQHGSE